jgi:hypothetical protein
MKASIIAPMTPSAITTPICGKSQPAIRPSWPRSNRLRSLAHEFGPMVIEIVLSQHSNLAPPGERADAMGATSSSPATNQNAR